MTTAQISTPAAPQKDERRLARAVTYVSSMWLPLNPSTLKTVREGFENRKYDLDLTCLLEDVKSDIGLYAYLIRESSKELRLQATACSSPLELFKLAGVGRLRKYVNVDERQITSHDIRIMDTTQAIELETTLVGAGTAELLAEHSQLETAEVFATAVLRRLGILLISWNYPSVFGKAMQAYREGQDLDVTLSTELGFAPMGLAVSLLRAWGLPSPFISAVSSGTSSATPEGGDLPTEGAEQIAKLCEIGEALARANHPETYPTASHDWSQANEVVRETLGSDGLKLIQERTKGYCSAYAEANPRIFPKEITINPETHLHHHEEQRLLKTNHFAAQCAPSLKKKFRDVYGAMQPGKVCEVGINALVKQIIPFSGFLGGVVYTLEAGSPVLMPRLRVGEVRLRQLKGINIKSNLNAMDPVATAFDCSAPLTGGNDSQQIRYIAAMLGGSQRVGVLYLEFDPIQASTDGVNTQLHFKAIRQALLDCLALK